MLKQKPSTFKNMIKISLRNQKIMRTLTQKNNNKKQLNNMDNQRNMKNYNRN